MSWWKKLFGAPADPDPSPAAGPRAKWLPADDPGNPFGVPLLDLMMLQGYLATSQNPDAATKSVSWGGSTGAELDPGPVLDLPPVACELRYPAALELPDGLLYAPPSMDEKWVLGWRAGRLLAARSWTGAVEAVADGRRDGGALVLERLRVLEGSSLRMAGRLVDTFDWLIRSHALGQRIPFPVDDESATLLEQVPLSGFGPFGKVLFCAARSWSPPPPTRPLRADGDVIVAVRRDDPGALERAVRSGAAVDAPSTHAGYTALHIAARRADLHLLQRLLELGADPAVRADRGQHVLGLAVVGAAPRPVLDALVNTGLDPDTANDDGFTALHAAAEVNHADAIPWLVAAGASLEARTRHGHAPLHVACGLGHREVAEALLEAGADPSATSPGGTPLEVAQAEGKPALVELLARATR